MFAALFRSGASIGVLRLPQYVCVRNGASAAHGALRAAAMRAALLSGMMPALHHRTFRCTRTRI